ncbi:MAG: HesA/MoeB/ThiF family protein [Deltaproteobacteria bacterium]|nr:HesA/MoeB/ThiF family protein [Deltaproteobacteria bacterium]MBN2673074.1 HesA/MoeB/ThiF family protein [Deltaproteobacteria bacterium]
MSASSERYKRQLAMPEIGMQGQKRLGNSRVLVVGAGGLGSPVLYYLAAAGVGNISVVDFDHIEESNFNRQILHRTADVGKPKVQSAAASIQALNPQINVHSYKMKITDKNMPSLLGDVDMVVDAVDSFGSKLVINDACVSAETPFVHAGVTGWTGQVYLYIPGAACLRCFFPNVPAELEGPLGRGIVGASAGVIGSMQALLAIQFLLNPVEAVPNRLITFDGQRMRQHVTSVAKTNDCLGCGAM